MKDLWQRFQAVLTPGVRALLLLLTVVYVAALAGNWAQAFDLYALLPLNGPRFWSGQVWRLATYALLPAGFVDFLLNGLGLILLGGLLERHWSRSELWTYCAIAVVGAGLAKAGLQFSHPNALAGVAPMVFALLVAWAFVCGQETISLLPLGEVRVWKLVLFAGFVCFLTAMFTAGIFAAIILVAAGAVGWAYLAAKRQWLMRRPARLARSERMQRLEL